MRRCLPFLTILFAFLLLWMFIPQPVSAQEVTSTPEPLTPAPAWTELPGTVPPASGGISSPGKGAVLSGVVEIRGTALSAWDLSFSYTDDSTGTWFPLAQSADPVSAGTLATWDTTTISDGFYVLRLHVSAADAMQDFKVNVRVGNYSSAETATSTPTVTPASTSTAVPVFTSTSTSLAEATIQATLTPVLSPTMSAPLPPNPATLNPQDVAVNFGKGALGVAALFVFFGLLLSLGRKLRS